MFIFSDTMSILLAIRTCFSIVGNTTFIFSNGVRTICGCPEPDTILLKLYEER